MTAILQSRVAIVTGTIRGIGLPAAGDPGRTIRHGQVPVAVAGQIFGMTA